MRRRLALAVLLLLWLALLAFQSRRLSHHIRAGVLLFTVEAATVRATRTDVPDAATLERNLYLLEQARVMDPSLVDILVARGSQYLLLRRPHAAIRAYEEALRLEPRPETYLNLGRAQLMAGQAEPALASFSTAVTSAPNLLPEVPSRLRDRLPSRPRGT